MQNWKRRKKRKRKGKEEGGEEEEEDGGEEMELEELKEGWWRTSTKRVAQR